MNFAQWLASLGIAESSLNSAARAAFVRTWRTETGAPGDPPPAPADDDEECHCEDPENCDCEEEEESAGGEGGTATAPKASKTNSFDPLAGPAQQARAESARRLAIGELFQQTIKNNFDPQSISRVEALCRKAINDGWSLDKAKLEVMMVGMTTMGGGTHVYSASKPIMNDQVLEAAIHQALKTPNLEKSFSDRVLQAAHTHFRDGIGFREIIVEAAKSKGYRERIGRNLGPVLAFAFNPMVASGGGASTISLPGILGNVLNKAAKENYMEADQSWRKIAKIGRFNDFREKETYSLNGQLDYELVPAGGKLPDGTLGEEKFTNRAKTFGKKVAIDRRDWRNDDLGVFNDLKKHLGIGAANTLNRLFWKKVLSNKDSAGNDFFAALRGNYDDGSDSVLNAAGLKNIRNLFAKIKGPNGTITGLRPKIMLVPDALWSDAYTLTRSAQYNLVTASAAATGTQSPWFGMFELVASPYLQDPSLAGYSELAWYLFASPNEEAAIEVGFLDGQEYPTIESTALDFDTLGIVFRGFHDWGVEFQNYRAAIKAKGEN